MADFRPMRRSRQLLWSSKARGGKKNPLLFFFADKDQDTMHLSYSTLRAFLFPLTVSGVQLLKIWKSVCHRCLILQFVKRWADDFLI